VARVVRPASKLATARWWTDTTLAADLGVADASRDEIYATLDWLAERQPEVEAALARRHLGEPASNPHRLALFDLSSSWVTGSHCPLAAHGYSRDGRRGYPQIEYGLLTDPDGRPVAVRVFAGNTADPAALLRPSSWCGSASGSPTWSWSATGAWSPTPGSPPCASTPTWAG
jgi:hypothetical protein